MRCTWVVLGPGVFQFDMFFPLCCRPTLFFAIPQEALVGVLIVITKMIIIICKSGKSLANENFMNPYELPMIESSRK